MSEMSEREAGDETRAADTSFEPVIEACVRALEAGTPDPERLCRQYPAWREEIHQFLSDWGGMEQLAVSLAIADDAETDSINEGTLPRSFGDFQLLTRIASGGMGTIYRARQYSLDRLVAIKILHRGQDDSGRFRIEAEAVAALSHPNIITIHEVGITEGIPWLAMQLVEGSNLKQMVERDRLPPRQAAKITQTIARAVHHAHQRGVLHRDLKPANVLIDQQGVVFVTDFGLAKLGESQTEVTHSGAILGTPGYMSPEQAAGKVRSLTVATDVYGLGALLYALLTGHAPFEGESSFLVLRRVVEDPVVSPRHWNAQIDRDLETICLKCLQKAPAARYASADDLADDLDRYLSGHPVIARPVSGSERLARWCKRNPVIAGLSGAVVMLLVAATVFAISLAWNERETRLLTEANAFRETRLRKEVTAAFDMEKLASRNALQTQINLMQTNALWQARSANIGEAILWFGHAAALMKETSQRNEMLVHLESWLQEHPVLVDAFQLPSEYCGIEDVDSVQFHPSGTRLLYRSRRSFLYWDLATQTQVHLNHKVSDLTWATWDTDGDSLLIGNQAGELRSFDTQSWESRPVTRIGGPVVRIMVLEQGRSIATVTGKELQIFDRHNPRLEEPAIRHARSIIDTQTNSQGNKLICTDAGRNTTVYDVQKGTLVKAYQYPCQFRVILDGYRNVFPALINDQQVLVLRTADQVGQAIDLATGEKLGTFRFPTPVYDIDFAPDQDQFVTGQFESVLVTQFRRRSGSTDTSSDSVTIHNQFPLPHPNRISAVTLGTDNLLATGGWNNEVRVWKLETPRSVMNRLYDAPSKIAPLVTLPHQNRIRRIMFTPDNRFLITIQIDGLTRLWQLPMFSPIGKAIQVAAGGSLVRRLDDQRWMTSGMSQWSGHMDTSAAFDWQDATVTESLANARQQSMGHLLGAASSPDGGQTATIHAAPGRSHSTFVAPDGEGGVLCLWDSEHRSTPLASVPMPSEPRWVDYSPDGRRIAVCTARFEIVLVDSETRKIQAILDTYGERKVNLKTIHIFPQHAINEQILFTPDSQTLIAWSSRKRGVFAWDLETHRLKHSPWLMDQPAPAGVSLAPDGKHLAIAGGASRQVTIVDLTIGQASERVLEHPAFVASVAFCPEGSRLVTACRDGQARVWEWRTGETLIRQLTHDADVVTATFSHDARFVLTLGLDRQLRVWRTSDGKLALRPIPTPGDSSQLLLSDDSRFVAIAGGQIRIVDLGLLYQPPALTLDRALKLGEVLATRVINDGEPASLSSEQWLTRWRQIKSGQSTISRPIVP